MELSETIERVRPSVVQLAYTVFGLPPERVAELGSQPGPPGILNKILGTGFFVTGDAHVITAKHVIDAGRKLREDIQDGEHQMSVGLAVPNIESAQITMVGNFVHLPFSVVEEDSIHDLALLKLIQNPFAGEVAPVMSFPDHDIGPLHGIARLRPGRPKDGLALAISGYPLGQSVMITTGGCVASSWSLSRQEIAVPGAPPVSDIYLVDIEINPGNSGGPAYAQSDGTVIGVSVATHLTSVLSSTGDEEPKPVVMNGHHLLYSAGLGIVVPTRYVTEMLDKHALRYESSS
jgi:S1-C subfamily serine protease